MAWVRNGLGQNNIERMEKVKKKVLVLLCVFVFMFSTFAKADIYGGQVVLEKGEQLVIDFDSPVEIYGTGGSSTVSFGRIYFLPDNLVEPDSGGVWVPVDLELEFYYQGVLKEYIELDQIWYFKHTEHGPSVGISYLEQYIDLEEFYNIGDKERDRIIIRNNGNKSLYLHMMEFFTGSKYEDPFISYNCETGFINHGYDYDFFLDREFLPAVAAMVERLPLMVGGQISQVLPISLIILGLLLAVGLAARLKFWSHL